MSRYIRIVVAAVTIASFFYMGCILDPKPDKNPPDIGPPKEFKPLTEKENIVYNLVLSYERTDITHYREILHDKYIWFNQERCEDCDEESYTKEQDVDIVNNMFMAANGQPKQGSLPIDKISLTIPVYADPDRYWVAYTDSVDGKPCEDCWSSTREYTLDVIIGDKTLHANDLIMFVIVPVDVDGVKEYRIRFAYDLEL